MLKTLGAQIKEFIPASIATPLFMLFEVLMETIIPLMMASIVDDGVNVGDTHHIMVMGGWMVVAALLSLLVLFFLRELHKALLLIFDKGFTTKFRLFLLPILINTQPRDWLPV